MRKLFWLTIFILGAVLLALWSPWRTWNLSIATFFGITPPQSVSGLQVSSLAGELTVLLDGAEKGKVTPENSPLLIIDISPGQHQVQLKRQSAVDGAYASFDRVIDFHPGADVVIAYELGPTPEFSAGHVIYVSARAGANTEDVLLNVKSSAETAIAFIDNVRVGNIPITEYVVNPNDQHRLRLESAGFEKQEFVLLPDSADDRAKLKGLTLNVEVDLFMQPINVRDV